MFEVLGLGLLLTPDFVALQLCVWDWILAFSDELQMLRIGGRRFRYLLDMVYLVVRQVSMALVAYILKTSDGC